MSSHPYYKVKRPGEGVEKFFGELELAVMGIAWQDGSVSVRDVLTALNQGRRNLAYTTVMTIMSRLAEKGWLEAEKAGKAYRYRAIYSREETEAAAVRDVLHTLLQDFGDLAVVQFIKELDEVSPQYMAHLAELLLEVQEDEAE